VDLIAVADASLIPDMMYRPMEGGEGNCTDWYIPFATNRMVIAYTGQSAYADEITS
jgi:molybdate/tungstate transport system substrate-binding protein